MSSCTVSSAVVRERGKCVNDSSDEVNKGDNGQHEKENYTLNSSVI